MERNESTEKSWSRMQVCGLALICLIAAISFAYMARASFRVCTVQPQAVKPAVAHAPDVKITLDQLKLEADKQAEHVARIKRTLSASLIGIGTGALSFYLGGAPDAAGLQNDGFLGLMLMLAGIRDILVISTPEDLPPGRRERYEQSGRNSKILVKKLPRPS